MCKHKGFKYSLKCYRIFYLNNKKKVFATYTMLGELGMDFNIAWSAHHFNITT